MGAKNAAEAMYPVLHPEWQIQLIKLATAQTPNKTTAFGMRMTPQLASSACNLVAVACDGWSNNASKVKLPSVTFE